MRNLFVVGTSGLAKQTVQLALRIDAGGRRWKFAGYISRDSSELAKQLPYGQVVGDDAWLAGLNESSDVVLGVGYPRIRKAIIARLCGNAQLSFPNLIHPSVEVDSEWVRIGQGNVISNGCIFTCDISIRDYNFFNRSVTVGHDCTIGSYNVVNPGSNISGYVRLGDEILVGTGAQILARLGVASRTVIGAGAVVTRDIVEEEGVYVGMPARRR